MTDALNATGRPVVYSLCNWGGDAVWKWGASAGNSWRTGIDLFAVWDQTGMYARSPDPLAHPCIPQTRQTLIRFVNPKTLIR
jgi:alpha-galactosidase